MQKLNLISMHEFPQFKLLASGGWLLASWQA
jgi:hypothetical protein